MEFVDFFSLDAKKEEPKKEETKEKEKKTEETDAVENNSDETEEVTEVAEEISEEPTNEDKKSVKKEKKETKAKSSTKLEGTYEYPFSLYTEGRTVDISEYGFEDGRSYTPKQICDIMLKHRHYEFAGEISFKMFEDDNMLVATAKQYKKG